MRRRPSRRRSRRTRASPTRGTTSSARSAKRDISGAGEALAHYPGRATGGLTGALAFDQDNNLARLDFLTGWCVETDSTTDQLKRPTGNVDATLISEICIAAAPSVSRYWNNLGLFLRDEGDRMRGTNNGAL